MKRFLLFFVASLLAVACDNKFEDEANSRQGKVDMPKLTAGFAEDTRTYVEDGFYLRWHEGDLISAFVGNTRNTQYIFEGETGDKGGYFMATESGLGASKLDRIYALYPYDKSAEISTNGVISCSISTVQKYAVESFGKGANTMVAVTKDLDDTFLSFKNACGYLKIKLYGEGAVKSIELKGNNGEKIAGKATISAEYGAAPKVVMSDDATDSITLDCGEGITLSSDAENPTEFWFVVPPTEFSDGLTIVATDIYGTTFVKSTSNAVTITRNEIQPMAALEAIFSDPTPANNEIWYTSSDGEIVTPYNTNVFGANIVSNTYADGKGVITFDGNVTTIGERAFYDCDSLTSVTIPDSVTTIGGHAFSYCTSLTSITIGDSVTTIGNYAFLGCSSLTSVTIPDSVTTIGDGAFCDCRNLTEFNGKFASDGGRCLIIDGVLNSFAPAGLTEYIIPDSVTTIGDSAFSYCASLKEFKGKFASDNGRCLIVDGVLNSFANGCGTTEYTIPDSVTTIGYEAFRDCDSLTSVTIGDSVTTIGRSAFSSCDSLTSVTIGDSVTTIGDYAFYDCDSLTSVTIGDSVTTIGGGAFCNCTSLTSVTIGNSVTTIGKQAFYSYSKLKYVYSKPTTPPSLEDYVFYSTNIQAIYVPTGSVEAYKAKTNWKDYANKIKGYDF